jgi:hypothetical protein
MAVFIRTDSPVPPGTASLSSTSVYPSSANYVSYVLYYTRLTISAGSEATIASLSITLSKRSLVVVFVAGVTYLGASNTFRHRIYVNSSLIYQSAYDPKIGPILRVFSAYTVLNPGSYTVSYRLYNGGPAAYNVDIYNPDYSYPGLTLVVAIVPLEP